MDSNIGDNNKLLLFFSYSTRDKTVVGHFKKFLEHYGFVVFVAHDYDAIKPAVKWKNEIIDNIRNCDVFIPFITNDFKESNWTDQETGMAKINDKFIIPIEVDKSPYGFIGNIQSLRVDKNKLLSETPMESERHIGDLSDMIFKTISGEPRFEKHMINIFIKELRGVVSYSMADNSVKLIEQFNTFTSEQVNQILQITKENGQINEAHESRITLTKFFTTYKDYCTEHEYTEIINLLNPKY